MSVFTISDGKLMLDNEEFRILSGAIHYFRVLPELWEDRLKKLRACGFNCVETYMCWNLHERKEGVFDFEGGLDFIRFIQTAEKVGLKVILRPGPYICAEWDCGGFPSWLIGYPDMKLRNNNPLFMCKQEGFIKKVCSLIKPHLCTNGGNIIMLQVENEYGSYGDDKEYIKALTKIYRDNGIDILLFTSDGGNDSMISCGNTEDLFATANFYDKPAEAFSSVSKLRPGTPFMCTEYWDGWFDHWYDTHHSREPKETASTFEEILDNNGSVNLYMFHGGTNFGFYSGANLEDNYNPTLTSYDYDAPLSECGDMTEKYFLLKEVVERKFGKQKDLPHVENSKKIAYGKVELKEYAYLFDNLPEAKKSPSVLTMEETGQDFGYILYRTEISNPFYNVPLNLIDVHDRAHIYINGKFKGIVERTRRNDEVIINNNIGSSIKLDILVENMGRVNYGPSFGDRKGILGGVRIGNMYHFGWDIYNLPIESLPHAYKNIDEKIMENKQELDSPVFLRGYFEADEKADTFLHLEGFKKGVAFINGFNLGRYFNTAGPQKSLYVPSPLIKKGKNQIVVLETDGFYKTFVELKTEHILK